MFDITLLKKCIIFKNFNNDQIKSLISNCNFIHKEFSKEETVAFEGDDINSIGIILRGSVEVQKLLPSGRLLRINKIPSGGIFGEVIIFSNLESYPSTITAAQDSEILFISKHDILKLCSEDKLFLKSFMGLLSNKLLILNNKIGLLSYKSIRQKIAIFLINQYKKQNNLTIKLKMSRKEMAENFGIPRPSLSRELIKMNDDGLITFEKKNITILDIDELENCLF